MANFTVQLEEIKRILKSSSNTQNLQKSHAYSTLLNLQEIATTATDSCLIQLLGDSANVLVSLIVVDIFDDDEEIGAQALKCLGFMIYHPSIVPQITGDNVDIIIDSLVKVITTTRIKSVCNLGVWCISIQQFSAATLDAHFHSLLRAIVYALDNPIGSLSITFEAMQAVVKLATLLGEKMRDMAKAWAPPIYRRLVSVDKREREITERCLLRIRFLICPAPVTLSQTLLLDVKEKLLPAMKQLLNLGMKVQTMQAWGWFTRILGPYAMKSKNLVNEMLKLPEQTFADSDPQVQIAALVAWEAMIDALVLPPIQAFESNAVPVLGKQYMGISAGDNSQAEADRFLKRIKLIMTPLIGIISSKCDMSVHVACLNTWSYLLYKLHTSISSDLVVKSVWEPILELIFQNGPDHGSVWLWNICMDLLDAFISAGTTYTNDCLISLETSKLLNKSSIVGPLESSKCSWKHYEIKWSPWDLNQLEFFIKMIDSVINQVSNAAVSLEFRRLAHDAAFKLFRSLLRAIQGVVKCSSVTYDEIMLCLNAVLGFLKKVCEKVTSEDGNVIDLPHASLQLLEVVSEEIESLVLVSSLYRMALDLKCLDKLEPVDIFRSSSAQGIHFFSYMDKVSPIVYLTILYFSVAVSILSKVADCDSITDRVYRYAKLSLCSHDTLEVLYVFVGLLYKYEAFDCLGIWKTLANCLKDYIDDKTYPSLFKRGSNNRGYFLVLHLLLYPFAVCSLSRRKQLLQVQDVIEVWKLLYVSVNHDLQVNYSTQEKIAEDLSSVLNGYLDDITVTVETGAELYQRDKNQDDDMLSLMGNIVICVLEQLISRVCSKLSKMSNGNIGASSTVKSCLDFVSRFLELAFLKEETIAPTIHALTSRIFYTLANLIDSLLFKEDIVAFSETMTTPLLKWLSLVEVKDENTIIQLQLLWAKILNSLQRSRPSIKFDSSFLKFQASLLEKTLDHWNFTISENTIKFWNSIYGEQVQLEYPQNLLPILDKIARNRKINICQTNLEINGKICSGITSTTAPQKRFKVTAKLNSCSKRVELIGGAMNELQRNEKLHLISKRKRPELTEHQKEVRRAQQGRARDCNGHGPGIRTYTSVDFSQANEESQESQEIRDADSILEMLRRVP